jgi:hypothetical protein
MWIAIFTLHYVRNRGSSQCHLLTLKLTTKAGEKISSSAQSTACLQVHWIFQKYSNNAGIWASFWLIEVLGRGNRSSSYRQQQRCMTAVVLDRGDWQWQKCRGGTGCGPRSFCILGYKVLAQMLGFSGQCLCWWKMGPERRVANSIFAW